MFRSNSSAIGRQREIISRCLDTVGDGSGNKDATGNYASAPESFLLAPNPGEIIRIERMIAYIEDVGSFDSGTYGNGIALANGIIVRAAGVMLTDPALPITTNGEWSAYCYDVVHHSYGAGNEYLSVRWTFAKAGQDIRLVGDDGDSIEVVVNDDMSGLEKHRFLVQGYYEVNP